MIMEEGSSLRDWEILSDSDEANPFGFEDIIHSDYFNLDSTKLHHARPPPIEQNLEEDEIDSSEKISMDDSRHAAESEGYLLPEAAEENETGSEGIEPMSGTFDVADPNDELGIGETNKASSFLVDDSVIEVGFEGFVKGESFSEEDSKRDLGHQNPDIVGSDGEKGCSSHQNSEGPNDVQESGSDSPSAEMGNSGSIAVGCGEKKVLVWWKLPLDILKLCACRMRTVWSIPIAAAFIGVLMVGRRLYKMKHKSKRIPLKINYGDKKAASQLLLHAAQLNEVVVRRVPVIRSPLLPAGGVTPWPVIGLL